MKKTYSILLSIVVIIISVISFLFFKEKEEHRPIVNCKSTVNLNIASDELNARAIFTQSTSFLTHGKGLIKVSGYIYRDDRKERFRVDRAIYFNHKEMGEGEYEILITRIGVNKIDNTPKDIFGFMFHDNYSEATRFWTINKIEGNYFVFGSVNFPFQVCQAE